MSAGTRIVWELVAEGCARVSLEIDPHRPQAPIGIGMSSGSVVLLTLDEAMWLNDHLRDAIKQEIQ